tara:strand:+ start:693 stop:1364 length:672 start_codon:yes stop_codon:yes gene_type:complete
MAYGMRSKELAAVGRNVNEQGGNVDDASIQEAMDAELDETRKATVARNRARRNKARIADAETKAGIRDRALDAVKTIAISTAEIAASSPKFQAKQAARRESRLGKRADRMFARGADAGKIENVRTRSAEAGFKAAKLNPTKYGGTTGAYGTPGSLYGAEPPSVDVSRDAGDGPGFKKQLQRGRTITTPTTTTDKAQYMKSSTDLAELKAKYPDQYADYMKRKR